jgi:hypothetical protein
MEITEDFGDVCREGAPFPEPLLAKLVAVPHHALRQGEIHVVLVAIECFFARYKIPYQQAFPQSLWGVSVCGLRNLKVDVTIFAVNLHVL